MQQNSQKESENFKNKLFSGKKRFKKKKQKIGLILDDF
jgi:hypothetical protein